MNAVMKTLRIIRDEISDMKKINKQMLEKFDPQQITTQEGNLETMATAIETLEGEITNED